VFATEDFEASWVYFADVRAPSPPIPVAYNATVVIREMDDGPIIVFSVLSDPVLYSSKCYIVIWHQDSISQLNEYLQAQHEAGFSKPLGIPDSDSKLIVSDSSKESDFSISGKRYSWILGGGKVRLSEIMVV
jgi:hypothetical protein